MMVLIMGKVLLGMGGGVGWNEQLLRFMTPKQPSTEVMWLPGTNKTRTSQAYNGVCVNNINDDVNAPFLPTPTHTYAHIHMQVCIHTRRRQWHPTPVLLPGKSHGRRGLVGCSPWGLEESDTTERLHFHFSLSCIGEGNGSLLQCSCLENPRDRGAWWAAIYGVAQVGHDWSDLAAYTHTHTHGEGSLRWRVIRSGFTKGLYKNVNSLHLHV